MTITQQYFTATRKLQDSYLSAFEALATQAARRLETPVATPAAKVDPRQAVDQTFDFFEKSLSVQRETAHKVLEANIRLGEQWRRQAEQVQGLWREQAQGFVEMSREQSSAFTQAAREQAETFGATLKEQAAEFAKVAERNTRKATEKVAQNADTAGAVVAEQVETTGRDAADSAAEVGENTGTAFSKPVKRNYQIMGGEQLRAELATRKLPTTGSVDELRARLRENDAKA